MVKDVNYRVLLVHLTLVVICNFCNDTCGLEAGLAAYENASFSVPFDCLLCDPKFNHFVVHSVTGDIYLGASNSLVRLDSTYENNQTIVTRVECVDLDIRDCINHNKLLVIHYGTDKLITCGSRNGGTCQIRDSDDISMSTEYDISVVASGEQSTVYIIAPGKVSGNDATEDMLYVGATDPEKRDVPVVSRRRLEMENIIFSIPSGQRLFLSPAAPPDFRIDFVYAFTNDSFTYFLTNQRYDIEEQDSSKYPEIISKVYRVCHDYHDFDSFANINMECQSKTGQVYNLAQTAFIGTAGPVLADNLGINPKENVLFALFSKGVEPTSHTPTNQSAICVFKLDDIQRTFIRAIADCLKSKDNKDSIQFLDGSSCDARLQPEDSLRYARLQECQAINYALARSKEGEAEVSTAIMEWQDTPVSSIITSTEQNHTIAFIGTTSGNLMKVHIDDKRVYETLYLGSPVLKDVTLDAENQHLTVLTEKRIFKLLVENCGYYSTCEECIGVTDDDGDPYCGWCTLQRKCTRQHECPMPHVSTRWLSYNEVQCSGICKVMPYDSQPITVQQQITVTVEQLPDLDNGEQYQCVFEMNDDISLESSATKFGNDLKCMTPSTEMLPEIPTGSDHVTMLLSIRATETGVKFVDTNHTFYECTTHTRCIDCASSSWDCDWCTFGNVCTHDKANCPNDTDNTLIAGEKHHRANPSRRGPSECAQLEEHGEEVLLSVGVQRDINITVKNLPDISQVPASSYTCIVYIEGKHQEARAERIMDTVRCNSTFTYQFDSQELTANLTLQWTWGGNRRTIDDEFGFQVTLFKCEILRPDCSRCVSTNTTRDELRCGWCSASLVCAVEDDPQCAGPWIREVPDSGFEPKNCPRPKFSIWPSSGPIEGNTLLEISGTNIGRDFSSIKNVAVAERKCRHADLAHMYELGERIFCVTTMSDVVTAGDVFVTVAGIDGNDQMNDGGTTFTYTDPKIEEFNPTYGPRAGGTLVNINGKSLRTGRDIEIQIGNANCFYDRFSMNDEEVNCYTDESFEGNVAPITMTFDGSMRLSEDEYRYRGDPDVNSVRPTEAFEAGGRALTVTGVNLDVVQTPRILVRLGDTEYTEVCRVENKNATMMTCPSPAVNLASRRRRQAEEAESASVGFIMDGVRDLRMWSENENIRFAFEYYRNPNYFNFSMNMSVAERELQIKGERLNLASDESDVTVYIGDSICEVTILGLEILTCEVPTDLTNNLASSFEEKVTIIQGNLLFENIGSIIFQRKPPPTEPYIPSVLPIVGSLIAVIICLVLVAILISVYYQRRRMRLITEAKSQILDLIRNLYVETDRGVREAKAEIAQSIKLSDNVTIDQNDVRIQYSQLEFGRTLGKGEFGKVFMATLKLLAGVTNVAVKTVKENTDASSTVKFLEEAMIMKNFNHPNVLGLLGLTFDPSGNPLVVLPFMKNGDLRSFLLKHKMTVTKYQLLNFALDGAKGMTYLSEQKFVHRDIAARNCMIDEELTMKIADFGLSRDMHESDYYRSGDRHAKLPVKWMAPESLAKKIYSVKTDVWSFGIMLWELFSRALKPYKGIANRDVYHHIITGNRLSCPSQCLPEMYGIMMKCWDLNPELRPTFREIADEINSLIQAIPTSGSPVATVETNVNINPDGNRASYLELIEESATDHRDYEVSLNSLIANKATSASDSPTENSSIPPSVAETSSTSSPYYFRVYSSIKQSDTEYEVSMDSEKETPI